VSAPSAEQLEAVAQRLYEAHHSGEPVPAPSSLIPGLDMAGAYSIQRSLVARLRADGRGPIGWKVGMVSAIRRRSEPPGGPIYGALLSGMVVDPIQPIDTRGLHGAEVEGEVAFYLERPLRGGDVTVADVLAATRGVMPALEIIAGRLEPGEHAPEDSVADNAESSLAVLGGALVPVEAIDLRLVGVVLSRDGEILATGAGAQVLGHPAQAVAWLANALHEHGQELSAGQIVLSGSATGAFPVAAGETVTAEFDRLGSVAASFA
jgi:2-keto-4-pentenoate hydratase